MPPKAKFTREEIIEAAFQIARSGGLDMITARELGKRLGSSARPIFTVFENMEEVKAAVVARAKGLYRQYVENGLKKTTAFKGVGIAYITFAIEEPKLFALLFMNAGSVMDTGKEQTDVNAILPVIDASYEKILQSVQEPYGLEREAADRIYQHLWTYTHGIATMCATRLCSYTMEEIGDRMTEVFKSLMIVEKMGEGKDDKN